MPRNGAAKGSGRRMSRQAGLGVAGRAKKSMLNKNGSNASSSKKTAAINQRKRDYRESLRRANPAGASAEPDAKRRRVAADEWDEGAGERAYVATGARVEKERQQEYLYAMAEAELPSILAQKEARDRELVARVKEAAGGLAGPLLSALMEDELDGNQQQVNEADELLKRSALKKEKAYKTAAVEDQAKKRVNPFLALQDDDDDDDEAEISDWDDL